MTITLNGTTGITTPTETATTSVTAPLLTSPASTALTIQSAGTTAMTVDTSQNVGVGTTSPATKLQISSSTGPSSDDYGFIQANYTGSTTTINAGITVKNYQGTSQFMQWDVNGLRLGSRIKTNTGTGQVVFTYGNDSEAMRIDASGYVLIKTATSIASGTNARFQISYLKQSEWGMVVRPSDNNTGGGSPVLFQNQSGATIGTISADASNVAYNVSSDYRLKHSVAPIIGGMATVSALKPVTYKWIVDDKDGEGFIAHELAEHIPLAVSGKKDAVNDDGSIKPQGVDYSKIVVHLVAACQELSAKNDALEEANAAFETRLSALEAK